MIGRALALAGGVAGAVALSQFPEFSQQYLQRLAGKVDELSIFVADFDRTATRTGYTREAALEQMAGSPFLEGRRQDLTRTFDRHARLSADLEALRAAGPIARMAMPQRLGDAETLDATWADFRPAVPATLEGAISAGIGFAGGWALISLALSVLLWPFRRAFA